MLPRKLYFPSSANHKRCQLTAAKDRKGRIAQLVEQLTLNQRVVGSNPTAPTNNIKDLAVEHKRTRGMFCNPEGHVLQFAFMSCSRLAIL
jgi:hypothetical protein